MHPRTHAFTLIELLVVVTIIVVLLALLTPALDKAIYSAELAVCGARQHLLAATAIQYAMDQKRYYPPMPPGIQDSFKPSRLTVGNAATTDRRVHLKTFLSINKTLNDPLCPEVDLESPKEQFNNIYGAYDLWFGWRYLKNTGGTEKGMRKIGDRFTFTDADKGRVYEFRLLVGDMDAYSAANTEGATKGPYTEAGHPDDAAMMHEDWMQDDNPGDTGAAVDPVGGWTFTRWKHEFVRPVTRGLIDKNMAFDDGSVIRYDRVKAHAVGTEPQDDRFVDVPILNNGDDKNLWIRHWIPPAN